ncbi:MAG TPA: hypothetical protein VKY81_01920 [Natronosporangium sp.]|nr:hypothetical protein [Natronosporangium sp.]
MSPPRRRDGIHLDPDWPGLEAPDGLLRADPDVIAEIGGRLRSQARSLNSDAGHLPSTVPYLDDYRRSTTAGLEHTTEVPDSDHWFGRWPTAGDMEHGWRTARWAILRYYKLLVEQLDETGHLLEQTAAAYDSGEAANQAELAAARLQAGHTTPVHTGTPVGRPADLTRESTQVPGISMCEAVDTYDPRWILGEIDYLRTRRPWIDMSAAASSLRATSERLHHLRDWLRHQAATLAHAWSSPAAAACQHALQRIAATAAHLADRSAQLAEFTSGCAVTIATAVADFPTLEGRSLSEWVQDTFTIGADPNLERKHDTIRHALARLNQDYTDINHTMLPTHVDAELPPLRRDFGPGSDLGERPERPVLPPPAAASASIPDGAALARADAGGAAGAGATAGGVESHSAGASPAGMLGSTGGLAGAPPTPAVGAQSPQVIGGGAVPGTGGPPAGAGSGPVGGTVPGIVPGPGGVPAPRQPGGATPAPAPATGGSAGARATASAAGRVAGPGMLAAPMGAPGGQAGSPTRRSTGRAGLVGTVPTGAAGRPGEGGTVDGADDWLVEDEASPWEGQQDTPPEVIK